MGISVAIGTYNRAAMVRQAVLAALAQTRAADEIVISDDASSDQTLPILEALAMRDGRVRPFRQARNLGVDNWNFAIRQTLGEYIAWCSDDDRFLPGHLEHSVSYLEAHPEVGLVHSGFIDSFEGADGIMQNIRPLRSPKPQRVDPRSAIRYMTRYYDWPFHASTIVMRRAVWEKTGGFDPSLALADTDWFVRAAERFPVVLLPVYGAVNRRHPGNWSNRIGSAAMQGEIFSIVERAILRRWPRPSPARWFWRTLWRAHARLRLVLTLRVRIREGEVEAALAAWRALCRSTGRLAPRRVERWGETWLARRIKPESGPRRARLSPL